jgi:hypothetical protein
MKRTLALFAALIAFSIAAPAAESNRILSAKGPLALKAEQAPRLFNPCSRWLVPKPEGPLWLPTAAEVAAIEAQLEKYMGALNPSTSWVPKPGARYRGQYVGFVRNKVKYIYASYSPEGWDKHFPHGDAIDFCGGGEAFWGIVYNTATAKFSELSINGPL